MLHWRKKGGELVIVGLTPFLVRMMMALGAFHSDAEEDLTNKGAGLDRLALVSKDYRGPIFMCAALGCEQFAHELIIRLVLPETVAQPEIEQVDRFHADARWIGANQIAPLNRPMIAVRRIVQQALYDLLAFVSVRIRKEFPGQ